MALDACVSLASWGWEGLSEKRRVQLPKRPEDWLRGEGALPPGRPEGGASGRGAGVRYRLHKDDHGSSDYSEDSGEGGIGMSSEVNHSDGSPGARVCAKRQVSSEGFPRGGLGAGLRPGTLVGSGDPGRGAPPAGLLAPHIFRVRQRRG